MDRKTLGRVGRYIPGMTSVQRALGGLVVCVAGVLLAGGCAPRGKGTDASAALLVAVPSGWMGDTSKLGPSPYHPGTLFWQSPRLREYSRFYVDAVVVVPLTSVRGSEIDGATAEQLSTDLRDAVLEELGPAVVLVDEPGPGVATIRGAITKVARSRRGEGATSVGGAAMEVEIVDSVTRERLAAAIEADAVNDPFVSTTGTGPAGDQWYDARLVFAHWAARLRMWLVRAAGE